MENGIQGINQIYLAQKLIFNNLWKNCLPHLNGNSALEYALVFCLVFLMRETTHCWFAVMLLINQIFISVLLLCFRAESMTFLQSHSRCEF